VAEDTVKTCKRGHLRTPDNLYGGDSCKTCHRMTNRAARARYRASGKGQLTDAKYNASTKGWASARRYHLKEARETITQKLADLRKEEARYARYRGNLGR
jgi:hypothetical protein